MIRCVTGLREGCAEACLLLGDEDIEIVSANSIEELIKKVQDMTYASMSDNVMTEAELAVGGHIDFKG